MTNTRTKFQLSFVQSYRRAILLIPLNGKEVFAILKNAYLTALQIIFNVFSYIAYIFCIIIHYHLIINYK